MESKELLDLLGFESPSEDDVTLDAVKQFVSDKYVHVDKIKDRVDLLDPIISSHYGKRMKGLELGLVKEAKNNGLDLTYSEIENMKIEDAQAYIFDKFNKKVELASQSDEGKSKQLQAELQRLKEESNSMRNIFSTKEKEYKEAINGLKQKELNAAANAIKNSAFGAVKYKSDVKPIAKKGFQSEFDSKYKIAILDDGSHELRDVKDNRVPDPDNLSKHLTVGKAVELLAKENDLWDSGKHGGTKPPVTATTTTATTHEPNKFQRKTSPAFGLGIGIGQ